MNRIHVPLAILLASATVSALAQSSPSMSGPASSPSPASAPATPAAKVELAQSALAVFLVKCVQCHGPQAERPAKGFGYVTDLRKIVEGGKVVPGKPEDSLLYKKISSGQMPPAIARNGGLSPEQIAAVRAWIAAGAPAIPTPAIPAAASGSAASAPATGGGVASGPAAPRLTPAAPSLAPGAGAFRRFAWEVGKYHLQLVHFPIALLLAGVLAELLNRWRPAPRWRWCGRFCLWLGAISAVAAASTGWLLDSSAAWTDQQDELLDVHGWLGTSTAILAVVMIVLGWVLLRRQGKAAGWLYLAGIVAAGVLVGLTGRWGGMAVWGKGLFFW